MQFRVLTCAMAIVSASMLIGVSVPSLAQTDTTIYNFQGAPDGSVPQAHLIRDSSGNLYGTTVFGGSAGFGTVFKIDSKGNRTILYNFVSGSDGANPAAALIRDSAGNLYGTTMSGGVTGGGNGTVFEIDSSGKETVLYSFKGTADGAVPLTSVVRDGLGNLYGTTSTGGNTSCHSALNTTESGCGTIFKLSSSGTLKVLHTFAPGTDGRSPFGDLIGDSAGNLYGTTYDGGSHGYGCIFKLKSGVLTILYSFNFGVGADGARPVGALVRDASGNLYGTTRFGGFFNNSACQGFGCGTIFKLDSSGTETVLYAFTGNPDGSDPHAGVVMDSSGNLYGTTRTGGAHGEGTVFRLDTSDQETVLHSFNGSDGSTPLASLIHAGTAFFGTASSGGTGNAGVVFKLIP